MKMLALLLVLLTVGACSGGDDGMNAKRCLEACSAAADCVTTGTTVDDWKCEKNRCVYNMCSTDDDCTPGYTCEGSLCVAPNCTGDDDCVAPEPFCDDGSCVQCRNDNDCSGEVYTKCSSLGMCGCADDSECNGALTLCTGVGVCGCRDDSECTQSSRDMCYDGVCGCSSADVCTGATTGANTTWVCEKS